MKIKHTHLMLINLLISITTIIAMEKVKRLEKQRVLVIKGPVKNLEHLKDTKNAIDIVMSVEGRKLTINEEEGNLALNITGKRKRQNEESAQERNNKKQKKNIVSLDEEESNVEKSQIPLILGSPVTVGNEPESVIFILDEKIKLVRKKDKREKIIHTIFPYSSDWKKSTIIQGAINPTTKELRRYDGKIFLEEAEVKLLASVYYNDKEARRRLLNTFPIIQLAELLALLDKHDPARKFDPYCNYFDDIRQLLEEKVIKAFQTSDLNWLRTMNNLPLKIKNIMENTFKRLMKPVPHSFHWIYLDSGIEIEDHFVGGKTVIWQKIKSDGSKIKRTQVIDLETGRIILERYGVKSIFLTAENKVKIYYDNKGAELLNSKTNVSFYYFNVVNMYLSSLNEILTVLLENDKGIVIDLRTNNIIFEEENIEHIFVNKPGNMVIVLYKSDENENEKGKVIGIKNGVITTLFEGNDVKSIEIPLSEGNIIVHYKNNKMEIRLLAWAERNKEVVVTQEESDWTSFSALGTVIATWSKKGNGIIRYLEKNKILKLKRVERIDLNTNEKRVLIESKDQEGLIINLETGKCLWQRHGVIELTFSLSERFAIAYCNDDNVEIIDVENGKTILKRKDIDVVKIMPNNLAIIKFLKDDSQGIIDLSNRMVLFRDKNISKIICDEQTMKATILYQKDKKNTFVTMDLSQNYNKNLTFITLQPKKLINIFNLSNNLNFQNKKEVKAYLSLIEEYSKRTRQQTTEH